MILINSNKLKDLFYISFLRFSINSMRCESTLIVAFHHNALSTGSDNSPVNRKVSKLALISLHSVWLPQ